MAGRVKIEELLRAANEASGHVRVIWVTFLLFGTYLAITVGSTTHKDLLLESPVELPLLQVQLDLVTFYWVAPLFLLLYHLYVLVAHYVLAGKLHAFNAALQHDCTVESERQQYRLRLHPYLVTQSLAGPLRGWLPAFTMAVTTWISLVLAPVILFLAFQIRFLPYHDPFWTWVHRSLLLADLLAVWLLWPLVLHPSGRMGAFLRDMLGRLLSLPCRLARSAVEQGLPLLLQLARGPDRRGALAELQRWYVQANREARTAMAAMQAFLTLGLFSLLGAAFAIAVATIPDEAVEKRVLRIAQLPSNAVERALAFLLSVYYVDHDSERRPVLMLTKVLFDGPIHPTTQRPMTPLSRNLVLIDEDLVGDIEGRRFRGRDLRYAVLDGAVLRGADLTAAKLQGAQLRGADLRGAVLTFAQLQGALLDGAQLQGASLDGAQLQGASLNRARLQGALLLMAQLQGAVLSGAQLQGASLVRAQLQGAQLTRAQLQSASLDGAQLQSASLDGVQLQGASLEGARLQGAQLTRAQLQGARLNGAQLQGASLTLAQLQGASLDGAQLQGASLRRAALWRTEAAGANLGLIDLGGAHFDPMTEEGVEAVREAVAWIREDWRREEALKWMDDQLVRSWSSDEETRAGQVWQEAGHAEAEERRAERLADFLSGLACAPEHAPHVANGIAFRVSTRGLVAMGIGPELLDPLPVRRAVARRLLDPESCPGAVGLERPQVDWLTEVLPAGTESD